MAEILFLSLIQLIQTPDQYAGRHVRVIGYASLKFEGKALYISDKDSQNALTKNAVWLEVELTDATRKLNGQYVLVEGIFDPREMGHLKLYSGTIKNVDRLELWSDPKAPVGGIGKPK